MVFPQRAETEVLQRAVKGLRELALTEQGRT
jgi:hypothetical protein